jgi:RHH-type proline utilization regulon transcriptional repressor/proline dehydrogenase/delta 1-pyrroline-5-carboxylate dehydrogenase
VNASTWGLMLTGRLVQLAEETRRNFGGAFKRLVGRAGEPVIRLAVRQAMRIMGHQFVMGRTIEEALEAPRRRTTRPTAIPSTCWARRRFTEADADALHARLTATRFSPSASVDRERCPRRAAPSIRSSCRRCIRATSIAKRARVHAELTPRVLELAQLAMAQRIG